MGKRKPWTRNQILVLLALIVGGVAVPLVLHFLKKPEVRVEGDGTVIGNNANVTVDKRTVADVNMVAAKIKEAKDEIIAEMRGIDANKHEDLIKRYSFGYILFSIDHTNVVIPYESRLKAECALDISEAKVSYIGKEGINIELPNIECKDGPIFYRCGWGIRRQVGYQTPVFGRFHGIQMYLEMLVDHGDSFVCVLGFSSASHSE